MALSMLTEVDMAAGVSDEREAVKDVAAIVYVGGADTVRSGS